MRLQDHSDKWVETILAISSGFSASPVNLLDFTPNGDYIADPKLHETIPSNGRPQVVFRQVSVVSSPTLSFLRLMMMPGGRLGHTN